MNDDRWRKLFRAAQGEKPPTPPEDFDIRMVRAIRNERRAAPVSWWNQIGELFPRLAVAAALLIVLGVAADLYLNRPGRMAADVSELSEQWLFAGNGDAYE